MADVSVGAGGGGEGISAKTNWVSGGDFGRTLVQQRVVKRIFHIQTLTELAVEKYPEALKPFQNPFKTLLNPF